MNRSPLPKFARPVSLAAILLLLLQVQSVFACEMMEHSGPVSECCCGEMIDGQVPGCDCCTVETELSLKADPDSGGGVPLPTDRYSLEQPYLHRSPDYRWPPILGPPSGAHPAIPSPAAARPGRLTWLSTLRLRI